MMIKNAKSFNIGALFAVTFLGVLFMIFSPLYGGKNGLEFADSSFNKLAKGSSYFIPKVTKTAEQAAGKNYSGTLSFDTAEEADNAVKLFAAAGATADRKDQAVTVSGDLGALLSSAIKDADAMYSNTGSVVSERYGMDERKALKLWWTAFGKMEKKLKKDKKVGDAKIVSEVNRKALEPAYNFYQVEANNVKDHAGMMSGLLIFYVFYTMWWGYAIYYIFEGVGLTMKKAKVKKEA